MYAKQFQIIKNKKIDKNGNETGRNGRFNENIGTYNLNPLDGIEQP
jgi:hypothetical protein